MKISVRCSPNEERITFTFNLHDLGVDVEEWEVMTPKERESIIQKEVDGCPDQPYWAVDSYEYA